MDPQVPRGNERKLQMLQCLLFFDILGAVGDPSRVKRAANGLSC